MVLKVLLGTDVRDVAINARGPQTYFFDSTQLNRWKVSRANLATGSEYLNQQAYQSWSQRYQTSLMMTG
ncbi:hypothetical protein, partial [Staphylococcus pasteuri_A]